jgi:G3E family GTPase
VAIVDNLVGMLQQLNPRAQVVTTSRCDVDLQEVLLTGRFDMEQVGTVPSSRGNQLVACKNFLFERRARGCQHLKQVSSHCSHCSAAVTARLAAQLAAVHACLASCEQAAGFGCSAGYDCDVELHEVLLTGRIDMEQVGT